MVGLVKSRIPHSLGLGGAEGMGRELWRRLLLSVSLVFVLLPGAPAFTSPLDSDFTFTLPAGRKECFFQPMHSEASLEIEYQVREERAPIPLPAPRVFPQLGNLKLKSSHVGQFQVASGATQQTQMIKLFLDCTS